MCNAARPESMKSDQAILRPLVDRLLVLAARPGEAEKKALWADHQALRPVPKIPVCVYYEGIPGPQWRFMFGEDFLRCQAPLARSIEFDLRRSIWMAENVPDDHIVWPSIIISAPCVETRGWGVAIGWERPDDELGAKSYKAPFADGIDVKRLTAPRFDFDSAAVSAAIDLARELTGGRLIVFAQYRKMGHAPFDTATAMRGMQDLLMDTIAAPDEVAALMDFLTTAEVAYDKRREAHGWLNIFPEDEGQYQRVGFRVHCAHLAADFAQRGPRLEDEWAYLSAQTSAGLGLAQYAAFVHPYTTREAELFTGSTVYYHGCECLDEKLEVLAELPNLRRFHVSPWSSIEKARDRFQGRVVLEVHDHPGKVFFGASEDDIRRGLRKLIEQADGHPMDFNISDIHSFDGRPELLTAWARIAQEEATR